MPDQQTTDEGLLERARRGDEHAFGELYARFGDALYRFAYRVLNSEAAAEDVVHDAFLGLLRRPQGYDPARGASLRTYLYASARNIAREHFRHPAGALDELSAEPRAPAGQQPLRRLLDAELAAEVRRAVAALPAHQREVLVLFEYEELSIAEIAEIVGVPGNTVRSRLARARENLRRALAPYLAPRGEAIGAEK